MILLRFLPIIKRDDLTEGEIEFLRGQIDEPNNPLITSNQLAVRPNIIFDGDRKFSNQTNFSIRVCLVAEAAKRWRGRETKRHSPKKKEDIFLPSKHSEIYFLHTMRLNAKVGSPSHEQPMSPSPHHRSI